uniref:Uncharacterized protein n=1 Tax=Pygocentrus nattereri TaxID=42514 RepID=A0AAR2JUL5_PYGNA
MHRIQSFFLYLKSSWCMTWCHKALCSSRDRFLARTDSILTNMSQCTFKMIYELLGVLSAKKSLEEEKSKQNPEKDRAHCLWDSITMTMRQITPNRKMDKMEGWEPPQLSEEALGEERKDSSRYSSLTEPQAGRPVQWAARARDKLAAVRRRSPGGLSESSWEGLK